MDQTKDTILRSLLENQKLAVFPTWNSYVTSCFLQLRNSANQLSPDVSEGAETENHDAEQEDNKDQARWAQIIDFCKFL